MNYLNHEDTICSIITGGGISAIAVIRISGKKSVSICNAIFSKDITKVNSHTIHFGTIKDNSNIIDEVLISIFKKESSFTGEESVEISCHGSNFIQHKIIHLLLNQGCRMAEAGEFSMRAFKNGKLDLSQAESIADLIHSETESSHQIAIKQLKGGVSNKLQDLRKKLIDFQSLVELELDFSEEDVEFADKIKFQNLLKKIQDELELLIESFNIGNSIKNGIPVAIIGSPNVGKSTLLNTLLNENKAIVSDIPGTTRDTIEDSLIIDGFRFRFIDTAGIRESKDIIENLGIEKSLDTAYQSKIILFLFDPTGNIEQQLVEYKKIKRKYSEKVLLLVNKSDLNAKINLNEKYNLISAKNGKGIEELKKTLFELINTSAISDKTIIITNLRHYEQLQLTLREIKSIIIGINDGISGEFLSVNIRQALFHLGLITGEVTTDDLLANIFGKFCIGK